jgi:uncharacterized protein (DUF2141 family)
VLILTAGCKATSPPPRSVGASYATANIHIVLIGLRDRADSGPVRLALWSSEDSFMKDGRWLQGITLPAKQCANGAVFEHVPVGRYAVSAFHDTMDCGRFRRNGLGLPQDPWAISGGGPAWLPPAWSRAAFDLQEGGATIELDFSHGAESGSRKAASKRGGHDQGRAP